MSFPPESGPIEVAVAKPAETIPGRSALAGGALYSVKIDGWRLVINRSRTGVELLSRRGTDLTDGSLRSPRLRWRGWSRAPSWMG